MSAKVFYGSLVVIGAAVVTYVLYKHFTVTKQEQIAFLQSNNYTQGTTSALMSFGDDYIAAWYKAAKAGQPSFVLKGGKYSTAGGKATA